MMSDQSRLGDSNNSIFVDIRVDSKKNDNVINYSKGVDDETLMNMHFRL